jgi:hypothetical protein
MGRPHLKGALVVSRLLATLVVHALVIGYAVPARAELAAWDQAKVTALAKELVTNAKALYDTFYKQPTPQVGSGQGQDYRRLKQEVRRVRTEARELADTLAKGEGREDTLPIYEHLMVVVRSARDSARRVFTTQDVQNRASEVRQVLNQLSPYYDPDAQPLQPATR